MIVIPIVLIVLSFLDYLDKRLVAYAWVPAVILLIALSTWLFVVTDD